jgi:hypothetical protein
MLPLLHHFRELEAEMTKLVNCMSDMGTNLMAS